MNILRRSCILRSSPKFKRTLSLTVFPLLTLVAFFISITFGSAEADLIKAVSALLRGDMGSPDLKIIFYIRLPRTLGALLAGAALAVSGVIIQAVLNNAMAAPNIIGVNAGAGFFVILAMAIFKDLIIYLPIYAFAGALLAALLIYAISAVTNAGRVTITLVGIAVSSILTAGINTIKTLFPDSVYDVSGFLIGGLSSADTRSVLSASVMILPALVLAAILSRSLDVLSLGEDVAAGLGINVRRSRLLWLVLAAVLAGGAVSFSGLIGFVGLIIPHVLRRFVGNVHRYLIPTSIFGGGAFLLFADVISRTAFAPYELPVGILMALVGGPFFILLIFAERKRHG